MTTFSGVNLAVLSQHALFHKIGIFKHHITRNIKLNQMFSMYLLNAEVGIDEVNDENVENTLCSINSSNHKLRNKLGIHGHECSVQFGLLSTYLNLFP